LYIQTNDAVHALCQILPYMSVSGDFSKKVYHVTCIKVHLIWVSEIDHSVVWIWWINIAV